MEDCHSIVCVKYVHMLLYRDTLYAFDVFCATAKNMVLVCRLLGGLSVKILDFASLTTNNGN